MRLSKYKVFLVYIISVLLIASNRLLFQYAFPPLDFLEQYLPMVILIPLWMLICSFPREKKSSNLTQSDIGINILLLVNIATTYLNGCGSGAIKSSFLLLLFVNSLLIYVNKVEKGNQNYILIATANVLYYLALSSLVLWLCGPILHIIPPLFQLISAWGDSHGGLITSYYLLCNVPSYTQSIFGYELETNMSVFVEKAFAAYSFGLALIVELFLINKERKFRIFVLFLTVLSTTSTTGIIISVLSFCIYIYKSQHSNKFLLVAVLPITAYYGFEIISDILNEKKDTISGEARSSDFLNGIKAWMDNPIFGWGYMNQYILAKYRTGFSNSISSILTQGGIALFTLYVIPFFRVLKYNIKKERHNILLFGLMFFVIFAGNIVAFNCFTIYILVILGKVLSVQSLKYIE